MSNVRQFLTGALALTLSLPLYAYANSAVDCEQFTTQQLTRIRYLSPEVTTPQICQPQTQSQSCNSSQLSGWSGNYHYLSCREVSGDEDTLPRMTISNLVYRGGFRLPGGSFGNSSHPTLSYSSGVMTYNPNNHSLFIAGHPRESGIAEFTIPNVSKASTIVEFLVGENLQPFTLVNDLDRIDTGVTNGFRINGLQLIDNQLIVNYMNNKASDNSLKQTSIVLTTPAQLSDSLIAGPYEIEGGTHASGWLTSIPPFWQAELGGTHISGKPGPLRTLRASYGPTAFSFNPQQDMLSAQMSGPVSSNKLLGFSFKNILQETERHSNLTNLSILLNQDGLNDLWTKDSQASFGVILPETSTYLTIGYSTVEGSTKPYYWLWDVNDLVLVKNGQKQASELLPYDHGQFNLPLAVGDRITGATFDNLTGSLYLALAEADQESNYVRPPLFFKYQLETFIDTYASCGETPHNEEVYRRRFQTATVPYGQSCTFERQIGVCQDGRVNEWSGTYLYGTCETLPEPLPPVNSENLVEMDILEYVGGFKIASTIFGDYYRATANFSHGIMAYNPENNSIFLTSHDTWSGIAEFEIPELVNSTNTEDFNKITESLQDFSQFNNTERVDTGIEDNFLYTGLTLIDNQLIANYVHSYSGNPQNTTIVIKNADDLANSDVKGPYQIKGRAHSAGWISKISDQKWQEQLGGSYLSGGSQYGVALNTRLSIGPAAFVINPVQDLLAAEPGYVDTFALLDFPLHYNYIFHPLYDKAVYGDVVKESSESIMYNLGNSDGIKPEKQLWNILSNAAYGFIVPGTDTYMTIGGMGGIDSIIKYKGTQSDGHECGGPCAEDPDDKHNYYWLWDLNDLAKVKSGEMLAYDVRPYSFGIFDMPVDTGRAVITGGSFDSINKLLYLSFAHGDRPSGDSHLPLFLAFKVNP